jgi:ABC-type nitrate/sulfonate/bicarbonate transport system permease component
VIGAIFGEYVGATEGLGIWMKLSQTSFRTDLVFGAILLTAIVSILLYLAVGVLERLVVPWSPAARREPEVAATA